MAHTGGRGASYSRLGQSWPLTPSRSRCQRIFRAKLRSHMWEFCTRSLLCRMTGLSTIQSTSATYTTIISAHRLSWHTLITYWPCHIRLFLFSIIFLSPRHARGMNFGTHLRACCRQSSPLLRSL
ncbi:hypothetical protein BDW72DRAFT_104647 [Aspergillus terricola var. indicus]